jgi:hypothetical protein
MSLQKSGLTLNFTYGRVTYHKYLVPHRCLIPAGTATTPHCVPPSPTVAGQRIWGGGLTHRGKESAGRRRRLRLAPRPGPPPTLLPTTLRGTSVWRRLLVALHGPKDVWVPAVATLAVKMEAWAQVVATGLWHRWGDKLKLDLDLLVEVGTTVVGWGIRGHHNCLHRE